MSELDQKKEILRRASEQGADLETLLGQPGWETFVGIVTSALKDTKDQVFSSGRVKNWNDYLYYKAKYDAYSKMMAIVDMKIERGKKASKELNELQSWQSQAK